MFVNFIIIFSVKVTKLDIFYTRKLYTKVVLMHNIIPHNVGRANDTKVHFKLWVSFFIVRSVVAQGKCNSVNIITLIAVRIVQLCAVKISPIVEISSISTKVPVDKYPIVIY